MRAFLVAFVCATHALQVTRRSLVAALPAAALLPRNARAADELVDVYFGCGCFWHVQHELVEAERRILGRSDAELTARTAYAGGASTGANGEVCYHNVLFKSDYGNFGHGEIVSMRIPQGKVYDFSAEYFKLFNAAGERPDQFGDRGTEYRNLVGLPGGRESPLMAEVLRASMDTGDKVDFAVGKGGDADAKALVWVMDNGKFPAYRAENYHQFHDGFARGENYPNTYNDLTKQLKLEDTTCPAF
ncbi:hypothetical protein M885DRAFT_583060 [Pelagophyceae sp. CCMP2097]|nr:hypothetical protein M885DRAFT_583060 [Pelagophyceae sp. CCMP2097]